MSKFDYGSFAGGYDIFAASKERYTKEEAIALFAFEYDLPKGEIVAVGEAWVKHRAGINEDNEPCVGWWMEYEDRGRCCPCYVFHFPTKVQHLEKKYEYVSV